MKSLANQKRPVLIICLLLGIFLLRCQSGQPGTASPEADSLAESTHPSPDTGNVAEPDTQSLDTLAEGTIENGDPALRTGDWTNVKSSDLERPTLPPDTMDPTRIFEETFEKPKKPKPRPPHDSQLNDGGFTGCWTDSREEYSYEDGFKIFRPCEYKRFPPSRFRFKMDLKAGGSCSWLWLAPNDGHRMKPGTWTYDEESKKLVIRDESGKVVKEYVVLEVSGEMLKVK